MTGSIYGLDLAEALTTARAMGGTEDDVLTDHLSAIEAGALAGIAKQRPE